MHLECNGTELMMGSFCMQGIGLQLRPAQAGKPAFREALMEVLSNPKYTRAAKAMSVKIRARKNTPVQEAAGANSPPCRSASPALIRLCRRSSICHEHAMLQYTWLWMYPRSMSTE